MEDPNVIDLFSQRRLPLTEEEERGRTRERHPSTRRKNKGKEKGNAPKNQLREQSPNMATSNPGWPGTWWKLCLVCQTPAAPGLRYCSRHNNAFYRWLTCIEPGCTAIGERRIPGQTVYRCPKHSLTQPPKKPAPTSPKPAGPGREAFRKYREARRRQRTANTLKAAGLQQPPLNKEQGNAGL